MTRQKIWWRSRKYDGAAEIQWRGVENMMTQQKIQQCHQHCGVSTIFVFKKSHKIIFKDSTHKKVLAMNLGPVKKLQFFLKAYSTRRYNIYLISLDSAVSKTPQSLTPFMSMSALSFLFLQISPQIWDHISIWIASPDGLEAFIRGKKFSSHCPFNLSLVRSAHYSVSSSYYCKKAKYSSNFFDK